MNPTFTHYKTGERLKSVGHKTLYHATKERPLLIKWKKHGRSQYGPFAYFEVDGDPTGEYCYNPVGRGEEVPDQVIDAMFSKMDAAGESHVLVQANWQDHQPHLHMEDANGLPVLPDDRQVQEQFNDPMPSPQEATGTPTQQMSERMKRMVVIAGGVVDHFQEHLGRPMTEHDRNIAITLFIESNRR